MPNEEPEWRLAGTLIHQAVAYLYAEELIIAGRPAPSWWDDRPLVTSLEELARGQPELIKVAEEVYAAYKQYWIIDRDERSQWEVISVEEEYRATIGELDPGGPDESLDAEYVSCKPDLVVRNKRNGLLYIPDHKSKSPDYGKGGKNKLPDWHSDNEFQLHWQAHVNMHIVRKRFPNDVVAGFIINRVGRKGPPYAFDRHEIPITQQVYDAVPRVLRAQVAAERSHDAALASHGPAALTPHFWECFGKYGPCDYRRVCNAETAEDSEAIIGMDFESR